MLIALTMGNRPGLLRCGAVWIYFWDSGWESHGAVWCGFYSLIIVRREVVWCGSVRFRFFRSVRCITVPTRNKVCSASCISYQEVIGNLVSKCSSFFGPRVAYGKFCGADACCRKSQVTLLKYVRGVQTEIDALNDRFTLYSSRKPG